MKRLLLTGAALGVVLAFAVPTFAQSAATATDGQTAAPAQTTTPVPGPGMGMGMGMMGHHGMGHHDMGQGMMGPSSAQGATRASQHAQHFARMCENADAKVAGRLAYTEILLKLTEAQKPAWTKFAATAKGALAPMREVCTKLVGAPEPTTLPERLAHMEQVMGARVAVLHTISPALTELYAALTADQRKQLDGMHFGHRGF
ncbi:Spy/CpxP family protein refolding chaperone [uncultured Gammaproteobacteria bacterium]